jgi:hypothetical protein
MELLGGIALGVLHSEIPGASVPALGGRKCHGLTGGDGWASLIITASEAVTVTHRKGVDHE